MRRDVDGSKLANGDPLNGYPLTGFSRKKRVARGQSHSVPPPVVKMEGGAAKSKALWDSVYRNMIEQLTVANER